MRCRMRCGDIWRCGGPIKKYVPVESIGIEGRTQEMTFDSQVPPYSVTYSINISPSDATKKDVRIESNNPSVISVDSVESGQVTFTIHSEGEARIRITSLADADISDEYGVTITAPSQQFSPNNGIFVDVDTEGTATSRKRRTKATAMGDRFTARVFALDEESEDYVLLEWVHEGDVSKTYVGAANEAYTRAMFTEEVTDKIARGIEALWDDGQIVNRFVKFTDEAWGEIEQFYSTPLTSESIEELQETLASDEIVTPPDEPIPSCPASIQAVWGNDVTIEVGQTAAVITNFTTTAECENVDYSNIVAYVRASYNVPSDVATASIDFNENKVYVTGVRAGECTVVFTDGDRSWSNNVTVTEPQPTQTHITSVSPNSITVNEGDMVDGSISYEPYDGDTTNFSAQSENTNIATVDFMGASGGSGAFQVWGVSAGSTNVIINDGFNSWTIPVTVVGTEPESYTFTINVENLPEGADIDGEIMAPETGEILEEISVSSFPMAIDVWTIDLAGNSHEGDGDININSFKEEGADKNYQINIMCDGYKPLFEAVGFDFNDTGDGTYIGVIEAINLDSDVSMTISFTPVEEPEE